MRLSMNSQADETYLHSALILHATQPALIVLRGLPRLSMIDPGMSLATGLYVVSGGWTFKGSSGFAPSPAATDAPC